MGHFLLMMLVVQSFSHRMLSKTNVLVLKAIRLLKVLTATYQGVGCQKSKLPVTFLLKIFKIWNLLSVSGQSIIWLYVVNLPETNLLNLICDHNNITIYHINLGTFYTATWLEINFRVIQGEKHNAWKSGFVCTPVSDIPRGTSTTSRINCR